MKDRARSTSRVAYTTRGECVEAEQLHGSELAEAVQKGDQHPAEHRASDGGQHDPEEQARRPVTEEAGALLDGRWQVREASGGE